MRPITHDPDARLDYKWDWSDWLEPGDTIASHQILPQPDDGVLIVEASEDSDTTVTAWITGGVEGVSYEVTCRIVTTDLREDDRTMRLSCWHR